MTLGRSKNDDDVGANALYQRPVMGDRDAGLHRRFIAFAVAIGQIYFGIAAYDFHHYVPRFLLAAWCSLSDNRLSSYYWAFHRLKHGRYSANAVAKLFQLYSLKTSADANWIERDFFTPQVDTPGADAYQAIMKLGIDRLTGAQVDAWTRFLVSLMVRGPDMVDLTRARGGEVLRASLAERPDE
ncbi:DUF4238 domain-containing protein [Duganella sp. FT50W]|uniref:DUF4238 domain-containing protein n=1 Tax=Duganella lactea TaxID=2692173 RepID=A0A6L8MSH7_9BURK|nr:DUF4238 domain-containing protein [Duganella lactea]